MSKIRTFGLLALCSLLLTLPWYTPFSGMILFVAFLPLLYIEDHIYENRQQYSSMRIFYLSYVCFLIWNVASTWWIYNSTSVGAILAYLANAFRYALVIWLFHITKRKFGEQLGMVSLVCYWVAAEFLYMNAEITWPWLNLGNGFAKDIKIVQWYEYTGILGGSVWVLITNVLIYALLKNTIIRKRVFSKSIRIATIALIIIIPMIFSLVRFYTYKEKVCPRNIVVLQPNIDPYNEKFGGMSNMDQLHILLKLSDSLSNGQTDYIVGPETAVENNIWETELNTNPAISQIRQHILLHPATKVIVGITSFKLYSHGEGRTITARKFYDTDSYYDVFNAAMQVDTTDSVQIYHKSKLVVGVEMMPYPQIFKYIGKFAIDLGGTSGSLGTQKERSVLKARNDSIAIAPVICYESVFGEYVGKYLKKGAEFIFIITNDGWWGNTPGYKQHLTLAQLRAIETRRSIARSANTGVSAFINQKGEVLQHTEWWKRTSIRATLNANNELTFYVRHGDYLGRIASWLSLLLLVNVFFLKFFIKKKRKLQQL